MLTFFFKYTMWVQSLNLYIIENFIKYPFEKLHYMLKFWGFIGHWLINHLIVTIFLILAIAYYTLLERKVMAFVQRRQGPVKVKLKFFLPLPVFRINNDKIQSESGEIFFKFTRWIWTEVVFLNLQPIADGIKLLFKELARPRAVSIEIYRLAPLLGLIITLTIWVFIPYQSHLYLLDLQDSLENSWFFENELKSLYKFTATAHISKYATFQYNLMFWEWKYIGKFWWISNEIYKLTNILNYIDFPKQILYVPGTNFISPSFNGSNWFLTPMYWTLVNTEYDYGWFQLKFFQLLGCNLFGYGLPRLPVITPYVDISFLWNLIWWGKRIGPSLPIENVFMGHIAWTNLWMYLINLEKEIGSLLFSMTTVSICDTKIFYFLNADSYANLNLNLLYVFALSSFSVYSIAFAGWSSHSKYSFLGSLRSAAQMISYEVSVALILIPCVLLSNSFNLSSIVEKQHETIWYIFPFLPFACLFFISMLVETNRAPFDLPEAESELVAGFMTEYGSITFAMFFLAEYGNMLTAASLTSLLFFGGWFFPFDLFPPSVFWLVIKTFFFAFLLIWVRASLPRLRYDQLMYFGWKILLPFLLSSFFVIYTCIFLIFWKF